MLVQGVEVRTGRRRRTQVFGAAGRAGSAETGRRRQQADWRVRVRVDDTLVRGDAASRVRKTNLWLRAGGVVAVVRLSDRPPNQQLDPPTTPRQPYAGS